MWAKIRGSPFWPAKILKIYGVRNQMVEVLWFNDYRKTKIHKAQLNKFHSNFEVHAENFDKHIGLKTAAKEALIFLMGSRSN